MMSTGKARRRLAPSLAAGLGLAVVPKCPLCIAAYLMSAGVGAEVATTAAPIVRVLAGVLLAAAAIALIVSRRRRAACCAYPTYGSTTANARAAQSRCSPTGVTYDSTSAATSRPRVRTRIQVAR
jgi:hypothetical protein